MARLGCDCFEAAAGEMSCWLIMSSPLASSCTDLNSWCGSACAVFVSTGYYSYRCTGPGIRLSPMTKLVPHAKREASSN